MPFALLDIDFDGEKELLMRVPTVGQRSSSCYYPYQLSWQEHPGLQPDDNFLRYGDMAAEQYKYYPLDDMTQVDSVNNTLIVYLSAGWWDNEWHYYRIEKGRSRLTQKIIE